jgi:hypothetical protein
MRKVELRAAHNDFTRVVIRQKALKCSALGGCLFDIAEQSVGIAIDFHVGFHSSRVHSQSLEIVGRSMSYVLPCQASKTA